MRKIEKSVVEAYDCKCGSVLFLRSGEAIQRLANYAVDGGGPAFPYFVAKPDTSAEDLDVYDRSVNLWDSTKYPALLFESSVHLISAKDLTEFANAKFIEYQALKDGIHPSLLDGAL